jgi:predicted DsbA family dithiol-disulfide isomerase
VVLVGGVKVEIWSDFVCPWCYVGKRRFEEALQRFEHRSEVEVRWRSFELDPWAPPIRQGPYEVHLANKYGISEAEAKGMIDRMVETGSGAGLSLRFDIARPGNTFDAHRLLHLAHSRGVQDGLDERLMAAVFTHGEAVSDADTLVACATDAGLEGEEARRVLGTDAYARDVREDEREAARLGVTGVPFFVFDRRFGVAGAQGPELLLQVLERAQTLLRA